MLSIWRLRNNERANQGKKIVKGNNFYVDFTLAVKLLSNQTNTKVRKARLALPFRLDQGNLDISNLNISWLQEMLKVWFYFVCIALEPLNLTHTLPLGSMY